MEAQFKAVADHALLVTLAAQMSDEVHAQVIALDLALGAHPPAGMIETVPALVNLLVTFDPLEADHQSIERHVRASLDGLEIPDVGGARRVVQVCYEPPYAPDLDAVADMTGLCRDTVINAHLDSDFKALMYGFAPGYAYLTGVPEQIQVPRKTVPVRGVPKGSVIIAGAQCLITTLTMPTGWSIIGRSPTPIFTDDPSHPFLFDVGDQVNFERIDITTFERLSNEARHD